MVELCFFSKQGHLIFLRRRSNDALEMLPLVLWSSLGLAGRGGFSLPFPSSAGLW